MRTTRKEIGARAKALRLDIEMTQTKAALILDMPRSTLSSIENGRAMPNLVIAYRITQFYNAPLDYLMDGKIDRILKSRFKKMTEAALKVPAGLNVVPLTGTMHTITGKDSQLLPKGVAVAFQGGRVTHAPKFSKAELKRQEKAAMAQRIRDAF